MNKIWKFFRGSRRALVFIFVASVIWLLFDMAALRLSFSEMNTRVLKEDLIRRGREKFKVLRDPEKMPHSSRREAKRPMKGSERGKWGRENFRKTDNTLLKAEDHAEKPQQEWTAQQIPGKGNPVPVWGLVDLKSFPPPSLSPLKRGREDTSKVSNSSVLMRKKQKASSRSQKTPFLGTKEISLVKLTYGVPSHANRGVPLKKSTVMSAASEGANKLGSKRTTAPQPDDSKPEAPGGQTGRKFHTDPTVPKSGETIALNRNETGAKEINGNEVQLDRNPSLSKFVANRDHLKTQSVNEIRVESLPKNDGAKVDLGKKFNFLESHIVIITKEEEMKTQPKEVPNSKDNLVIFSKTLEESQGRHVPKNRSQTSFLLGAPQKIGVSPTNQTNQTLTGGSEFTRVSLAIKNQSMIQNQIGGEMHLPEDLGMHPVLNIDVTLSPRNPKAPGQFGNPVIVPPGKEKEVKRRWKEGNFNVYLSDLIPLDRAIDDTRPTGCADQLVHNNLPATSIIMCFVDEVWSTLLRAVHSVLNRSPPHLIKEILLVDDFSTKGDVLTFLDSHVECNVGWLEPLLERVYLNRKKVACPVIEIINDKDLSYMTVDNFQRGIFVWPMNFSWKKIPPEVIKQNKIKETDVIRCPVMAGGLFSIDKKYFFELGTYDPGLDVWGGENMELSFKVWMCGGEIEIIPCSRVGHIFRKDNPYSFPENRVKTIERNLIRVAEVWLDEYKELFYSHGYRLLDQSLNVGNLTQQRELRKKLGCKSFKWYLENVFPDIEAPIVRASGVIINIALGKCISLENTTAVLEECDGGSKSQQFNYTWLKLIKQGDRCLAPVPVVRDLSLYPCDIRNKKLKWLHNLMGVLRPEQMDHLILEHWTQLRCLEASPSGKTLKATACDSMNPYQKWKFEKYYVA
ncbi:polypeptide N-acetylgalactosaminyltransferase 5-like isoform X2 [Vombatus ursinus]|uniref:polypeptide N-acetylgalactosaminyltransferase 5-like isoform X2 n=1 Tax=Vombatus ursinus TaxID=29139 RepID=UPI000FFD70D5|nr:polypeptide N-acetylgalactosaminyltransferase 5-like isoform X2 [Vombatus ursinus]XP_027721872.1 polypeptide N-acetylgalactosaminyltransferase 5-like isoform X2 [Vombatus ursinus]